MRLLSTNSALLVVTFLVLSSICLLGYWMIPVTPPGAVSIEIETGMTLSQVARKLEQQGVIRSATALKLLARLRNQSSAIHTGSYLFSEAADPAEILARLVSGDVELVSLTIPEGFNLQQIAPFGDGQADQFDITTDQAGQNFGRIGSL